MKNRPISPLGESADPASKVIADLFEKHGLAAPPSRLRDELANHLIWARYSYNRD